MAKNVLPLDQQVLQSFFEYGSGSTHAHTPIGGVKKYLPEEIRNDMKIVKKSVNRLVKKGLLIKHPTKGGMTYQLSKEGRDCILRDEWPD